MRIARRLRDLAAPDPDAPRALFARVLDGDALWLAVAGVDPRARLGLRRVDGHVVEPEEEAREELPDGLAVRLVLDHPDLPRPAPGERERTSVVALPPAGRGDEPVVVRTAPLPPAAPARAPRCAHADRQHDVRRGDDGALLLTVAGLAPAGRVVSLAAVEDERGDGLLEARVAPAVPGGPPRAELVPPDDPGPVPLSAEPGADGTVVVRLRPDDVPGPAGSLWALHVDGAPVLRPRHALASPDAAVVLPGLAADDDAPEPLVRWRWRPDGALGVTRPPRSAPVRLHRAEPHQIEEDDRA